MKADKIDMQKIIKQLEELYKDRDLKKEIEESQKIVDDIFDRVVLGTRINPIKFPVYTEEDIKP